MAGTNFRVASPSLMGMCKPPAHAHSGSSLAGFYSRTGKPTTAASEGESERNSLAGRRKRSQTARPSERSAVGGAGGEGEASPRRCWLLAFQPADPGWALSERGTRHP